jgi:uncharacterized protein YcfJ|tara:strand:- start:743 stop:1276 length:534 start_codon:yes stop_codon:yes gene_type:complete
MERIIKMKKLLTVGLLVIAGSVSAAQYATVVGSQEVMGSRSIPSQSCSNVQVPVYGSAPSNGGVIGGVVDRTFGSTSGLVGAIVGGVVGSQVGGGSGKDWATAAGAVIGAQAGDARSRRHNQVIGYNTRTECQQVVTNVQEVSGYHVTYEYNGMYFTKFMKYRPVMGSKAPVDINVR